jgi:hypothetical protein
MFKCKGRKKNLENALETKHSGGSLSIPPGSEGQFRSDDLRVMSPARSHCATSLESSKPHTRYMGAAALSFPPSCFPPLFPPCVCVCTYTCVCNTLYVVQFSNESHLRVEDDKRREKHAPFCFQGKKKVAVKLENPGIDPGASRMLSERSTI